MRYLFVIILVCFGNCSIAQHRPETGIWLNINLPVNFPMKWQWSNEASYRTLGMSAHPWQFFYRTGMKYSFNKQWNASAGGAYFFTKTDFDKMHHEFGHEFRIWEEAVYQPSVNDGLKLLIRLRTEQRFFAATGIIENLTAYRIRFRPGLNQELNDKWTLQLTSEYMWQLVKKDFSFNQNRLTFSGIFQLDHSSQLQAGYIWLKWPRENQHLLSITYIKNISVHGGS